MSLHTDIVYVWHHGGDRAVEDLRYSLRSVEDNWGTTRASSMARVFIVGDRPPGWGGFFHLPHEHQSSKMGVFRPKVVDAVRKMKVILDCDQITERFLYMYDDICLLQPVDAAYFERRFAVREVTNTEPISTTRHAMQGWDTVKALRQAGCTRVWNYETHLPRLFEKRRMREVIARFDPEVNRLLLPTLYFNYHYRDQEPTLLHKMDSVKAGFYGSEDANGYGRSREVDPERACRYHLQCMAGKTFLNWNDKGIKDPGLFYAMNTLWPKPSHFEVLRVQAPPSPIPITK